MILALSLLLPLVGCKQSERKEETKAKLVKVIEVASLDKPEELSFPGKVKSGQEADVAFRISGPIAKILVQEGQKVHKGQVLAKLDDRDYKLQLSATTAEYKRIKSEVDRVVKLHAENSVSENEYDKAVFGLKQITAKYNAHKNALNDILLKAPFDGFIVGKPLFRAGEMVRAGMPVLRLSGSKEAVVEMNIPASEYLNRELFANYYCTLSIFPNEEFPLELISIDQTANLNQLYKVNLRLAGKGSQGHLPTAGMTAMVYVQKKKTAAKAMIIPNTSVFDNEGKTSVWLVKGEGKDLKVEAKQIKVLEIYSDGLLRCSGLSSDERIVSAGVHKLKSGDAVQLIPEKSKTNVGGLL